uniref:Uncharacterized protein n=1 Tax=Caenorhabditis tropicalis TaxID=1561998 RepID=A0A1I7UID9_9PELO
MIVICSSPCVLLLLSKNLEDQQEEEKKDNESSGKGKRESSQNFRISKRSGGRRRGVGGRGKVIPKITKEARNAYFGPG